MEQIYHAHWESVFDAAFKRVGDEDVAQDIVQEIFISLWQNRKTLEIKGELGAYLHGAVKYRVINHFRSVAMRDGHQTEFAFLMEDKHTAPADSGLILQDADREVEQAMAQLPERMRLMVAMSRKEDKTIKEIASELDVSVQTVKNQITAAMKILKKNLSYILFLAFLIS